MAVDEYIQEAFKTKVGQLWKMAGGVVASGLPVVPEVLSGPAGSYIFYLSSQIPDCHPECCSIAS